MISDDVYALCGFDSHGARGHFSDGTRVARLEGISQIDVVPQAVRGPFRVSGRSGGYTVEAASGLWALCLGVVFEEGSLATPSLASEVSTPVAGSVLSVDGFTFRRMERAPKRGHFGLWIYDSGILLLRDGFRGRDVLCARNVTSFRGSYCATAEECEVHFNSSGVFGLDVATGERTFSASGGSVDFLRIEGTPMGLLAKLENHLCCGVAVVAK